MPSTGTAWRSTVPGRRDLERLRAELDADQTVLADLLEQNRRAVGRVEAGARDTLDYAALGYTIHNLYSLLENYALRIAKTFENQLESTSWHSDLVRRMTLEIRGVRPAVWDRSLARHVDELRRFRHAFRHIYDTPLDPDKLAIAQKHVQPAIEGVQTTHAVFLEKLDLLVEQIEEP